MAYNPTSDFPAMLRDTGDGMRFERVPGVDWMLAAMARAGMFVLWVNATSAPSANFATTVWLKTANASYASEGSVWLWDVASSTYLPATPYLWQKLFSAITTAGPP